MTNVRWIVLQYFLETKLIFWECINTTRRKCWTHSRFSGVWDNKARCNLQQSLLSFWLIVIQSSRNAVIIWEFPALNFASKWTLPLKWTQKAMIMKKVSLLLNAFKKRIQNLSTDFGIACDDMIDQLVTIQLISGILKDIKKEAKDDDVDLLLKSFCYCEEIECTSSCSFKTQKICCEANFHPCRMRFYLQFWISTKFECHASKILYRLWKPLEVLDRSMVHKKFGNR